MQQIKNPHKFLAACLSSRQGLHNLIEWKAAAWLGYYK